VRVNSLLEINLVNDLTVDLLFSFSQCLSLFLSVCLYMCVSVRAKKMKNYLSELDEIWYEYLLRYVIEVVEFWRHLTLTFDHKS